MNNSIQNLAITATKRCILRAYKYYGIVSTNRRKQQQQKPRKIERKKKRQRNSTHTHTQKDIRIERQTEWAHKWLTCTNMLWPYRNAVSLKRRNEGKHTHAFTLRFFFFFSHPHNYCFFYFFLLNLCCCFFSAVATAAAAVPHPIQRRREKKNDDCVFETHSYECHHVVPTPTINK